MMSLLLGLAAAFAPQSEIDFTTATWPEEGRPVLEVTAFSLTLRERPMISSAPVETPKAAPGQRLEFSETLYRTIKPGVVRSVTAATIKGRSFGSQDFVSSDEYYSAHHPSVVVSVEAMETFEYLQYRAEGACFIRIDGVVLEAGDCPTADPNSFDFLREPELEWWVFVSLEEESAGWLLVSEESVRVVDREF